MFQHQILKHLGSYHVSLQIRIESKIFRGRDWCVHETIQNPTEKLFFLQGHLLALGNFCRSLSEILERREERRETRGRVDEVQSSEVRGNRELPEFMEGIHESFF